MHSGSPPDIHVLLPTCCSRLRSRLVHLHRHTMYLGNLSSGLQGPVARTHLAPKCKSSCGRSSLRHASRLLRIRRQRSRVRCCAATERSLFQIAQDANDVYGETKTPWCQPWTILLSGSCVISIFWLLFGRGWWSVIAVGATLAVLLWWYLFLVEYPVLVKEDQRQRQSRMGSDFWEPTDTP